MFETALSTALKWLFSFLVAYITAGAVHRTWLGLLSKFPGPKLAALTYWYEFYYDVVLHGQYTFRIKELYAKYGPIIRINPYELHISDPEFYDTLYTTGASGEKRDKSVWYIKQFGPYEAMFSTNSHDLHRERRAAVSRFFSMASVRRLQPLLEENVQRLLNRFHKAKESEEIVSLEYAFAAFTNDVVTEYAYGESQNRLDQDDWGAEYHDMVVEVSRAGSLLKQVTWIFQFMANLPIWAQAKLWPGLALNLRIKRHTEEIITRIKSQPSTTFADLAHPTLFHEILQSKLPDSEKSISRLKGEALGVVSAGTVTTSWALSIAVFYILSSPEIYVKLKSELVSAIPDADAQLPLHELEQLQCLTAVIQEALRLSYGISSRLQRICPDKPLIFTEKSGKSWMIPKGTPVGMTSVLIHHDESIFPDSYTFRPERWIENPRLEKYMVAFSKGSRQCLGIDLAYAEMYLCLSAIFRRFGCSGATISPKSETREEGILQLYETDIHDVRIQADGFLPLRDPGSMGVRIRIQ